MEPVNEMRTWQFQGTSEEKYFIVGRGKVQLEESGRVQTALGHQVGETREKEKEGGSKWTKSEQRESNGESLWPKWQRIWGEESKVPGLKMCICRVGALARRAEWSQDPVTRTRVVREPGGQNILWHANRHPSHFS